MRIMPDIIRYTADSLPLIADFTPLFNGIGAQSAVLSGDTLSAVTSVCFTPSDVVASGGSIISSGLKASVVPNLSGGLSDGSSEDDYVMLVTCSTTQGRVVVGPVPFTLRAMC